MKINQKISISIFLIIFLLSFIGNISFISEVFAQNTDSTPKTVSRTVLVELFIQEGCLTCPTAEFCLEDLAWEYGTTKFILVQEHLWGDGYDTAETNARYDWYVGDSKKGTPDVFINGLTKRLQGLSCDCVEDNYECYKGAIDEELTRPSLLEISASKTPHPDPLPQGEREEKVLNIIIEGTVKNISDIPLKDLAVCGMVGKEGDEPGLYNYIQDIFPFQNMPPLLPGATLSFKFISEISLALKSDTDDEEEEVLHIVIFVQNLETKEILQALYVE
jgi:hypothetical protein